MAIQTASTSMAMGPADVTFSRKCYFILQLSHQMVTAVETDAAVTATVQGHNITLSAYSPVHF